MGKQPILNERQQLHVWILSSQSRTLEELINKTGKSKTDLIAEALAIYFSKQREWGVLV